MAGQSTPNVERGTLRQADIAKAQHSVCDVLNLTPLTADPSPLADGMVWYRGDTDTLHLRANGVTKTVTVA